MKAFKKIGVFTALFVLCSCNGGEPVDLTYHYTDDDKYQYIWEDNVIYNEALTFVEHEDGQIYSDLLYTPKDIISYRDQTLKQEYSADYFRVEGKRIYLLDGIRVPYIPLAWDKCTEVPGELGTFPKQGFSGNVVYTETPLLVQKQIAVTYHFAEKNKTPSFKSQLKDLPNIKEKLQNKEDINLVVYGDSIYTGCNATGCYLFLCEPFLEPFDKAFARVIKERYGSKVNITNTAVGATLSEWGAANVDDRASSKSPDLVFVGFGMNDGSMRVAADEYIRNIKTIVENILQLNPKCSIVVSSPMVANPVTNAAGNQEEYLPEINKLVANYKNVISLDFTTITKFLHERKNSYELLANNVNHPTDWLIRIYDAMLLKTFEF